MSRIAINMGGGMQSLAGGIDPLGLQGSNSWTPALAGYTLFLDGDRQTYSDAAGTTPATNGGAVKAWKDQSGNAHNGSQANAGNTLATSGLNGHNTVGTTSGTAAFDIAFTLTPPYTVFLVINHTWTNSSGLICTTPNGVPVILHQNATPGNFRFFASSGVSATPAGYVDATWQIYCMVWNGASSTFRINAQSASALSPGTAVGGGFSILPSPTVQRLAAVLVYPSALSTSDETIERNDLNSRFAIF